MVEDDGAGAVHRQDEASCDLFPLCRGDQSRLSCHPGRLPERPAPGHVHVGIVVLGLLPFRDAHRVAELETTPGLLDALADPFRHAPQDRPGLVAQEPIVTGYVHVLDESQGDAHVDVLLVSGAVRCADSCFFAALRIALPWIQDAAVSPQARVLASRVQRSGAEVQDRARRPGLKKEQRRQDEGFDVPHDVPVVVVIVRPPREPKDVHAAAR